MCVMEKSKFDRAYDCALCLYGHFNKLHGRFNNFLDVTQNQL